MTQQTFEEYVDQWDALVGQIADLNKQMKPLKDSEMAMRKAITASVKAALGDQFKEGVNNFRMADGRVLKVGYKVDRKVDVSEVDAARTLYATLNDVPCTFDELLRVKYEVDKRNFDKLEGEAAKVFSRAVVAKDAAPEVKLA